MKNYQLVLVLRTTLNEAGRKKFLETVKGYFKGAKFTKEEEWGEKVLAYPIKKQNSGFYQNFIFETEGNSVLDVEKKLFANDDILRYLLLKI